MILAANGYAARSMQQVKDLLRYPVKSLCSESRDTLKLDERGVVGTVFMQFAIAFASLAVAKLPRLRCIDRLVELASTYDEDVLVVRFQGGGTMRCPGSSCKMSGPGVVSLTVL
ncbi:MAG: hypothetical protein CMM55_00710 [Rhodospirillaceae bacterium]|nr:hypothetical protein [Rhodospirillaceae bacterium]